MESTPIGPIHIAVSRIGLRYIILHPHGHHQLEENAERTDASLQEGTYFTLPAARQVEEYLAGDRRDFDLTLDLPLMTPFRQRVLREAGQIPYGSTITYGELAGRIGSPAAARAVGQALARNPVPLVIPCHRVLAFDDSLRGYSAGSGIPTKAFLLKLEGVLGT